MTVKQSGTKHEWRDLTDEEILEQNKDVWSPKLTVTGLIDRQELASWAKTRVCTRCGHYAPDFLDPSLP